MSELRHIGPYDVVGLLGEGGKGFVYEAQQTEPVKRRVALKVLRSGTGDKNDAVRFAAEQQAMAMMDHPSIAKVFDAGTTDDGRHWFAMELIDGLAVTDWADKCGASIRERVRTFLDIADAVHHAHQKGIIHRDLKPSNIMVATATQGSEAKVIDFGIAKSIGLRLTDETLLTQFGAIIGTPAYMSPEQAQGTVLDLDVRADIYSLGVVLFELLVGVLPVSPGETGYAQFIAYLKEPDSLAPTVASRFDQLSEETQREIASQRGESVSLVRQQLAGDLSWIIAKALEKDPSRRYETAAAFGRDLRRYLDNEPVSARPPSLSYRARKFVRRNKVTVAAAALGVIALLTGTVAATIGMLRAEREATVATQVSAFMQRVFEQTTPAATGGDEVSARDLLDTAAASIESELAGEPLVQGRLMSLIGQAYRDIGEFGMATPLLESALEKLNAAGADPVEIAEAEYDLGYHLVFMSEFDRAELLLSSAIATLKEEVGYTDDRLPHAVADRGFNALRSGKNLPESEQLLRAEIPLAEAGLGRYVGGVGLMYYVHCWTLRELGDLVAALEGCKQSLEIFSQVHSQDHPHLAYNTLALGHNSRMLGRYHDALQYYDDALAINNRMHGGDHAETAYTLAALAKTWVALGDPEQALPWGEASVAMMARVHAADSTELARVRAAEAMALRELHRFDESLAALEDAVRIESQKAGANSRVAAIARSELAQTLLLQGRFDAAYQEQQLALDVFRRTETEKSQLLMQGLTTAGEAARRNGMLDQSFSLLQEALELTSSNVADHPVEDALVRVHLAMALADNNEFGASCEMANGAAAALAEIFDPNHWLTGLATAIQGRCLRAGGALAEGQRALEDGVATLRAGRLDGNIYLTEASAWLSNSP